MEFSGQDLTEPAGLKTKSYEQKGFKLNLNMWKATTPSTYISPCPRPTGEIKLNMFLKVVICLLIPSFNHILPEHSRI